MDDLRPFLFWTIGLITSGCAVAVVLSQNIVRAATWLLFALGGTSGLFFLLGADFVGATQLLVYVGGTLVLVIFGVMLTAQGPFVTMKTSAAEWALSGIVGLVLFGALTLSCMAVGSPESRLAPTVARYAPKPPPKDPSKKKAPAVEKAEREHKAVAKSITTDEIGQTFLGVGYGPAYTDRGKVHRTHYFLPFLIVSVHLLVVLIGAAYLARAKRRRATT